MKAQIFIPLVISALALANADAKTISYTIAGVTTQNFVTPSAITEEFPVGTPWSAVLEWDDQSSPLALTDGQSQFRLTKFKLTFQGVSGPWTTSSLPDKPSFTLNLPVFTTKDEIQFTSGWGPDSFTNQTIENLQPYSANILLGDPKQTAIGNLNSPPSSLSLSDWSKLPTDSLFKLYLNNEANQVIYGDVRSISSNNGPDISVQQPLGRELTNGNSSRFFGTAKLNSAGVSKTFIIQNTGKSKLTGLAVSKTGANTGDFIVGPLPSTSLAAGEKMNLKITFKPKAAGQRKASLRIASNDDDENPFNIRLSGTGQ